MTALLEYINLFIKIVYYTHLVDGGARILNNVSLIVCCAIFCIEMVYWLLQLCVHVHSKSSYIL